LSERERERGERERGERKEREREMLFFSPVSNIIRKNIVYIIIKAMLNILSNTGYHILRAERISSTRII
jgi:hypothetical protein